jgi:hypothetical protein
MPDMLVRLYDLPEASGWYDRADAAGYRIRRAEAWERARFLQFIHENFGPLWSTEAEQAFSHSPVTAFVAEKGREIAGLRLTSAHGGLLRADGRPHGPAGRRAGSGAPLPVSGVDA